MSFGIEFFDNFMVLAKRATPEDPEKLVGPEGILESMSVFVMSKANSMLLYSAASWAYPAELEEGYEARARMHVG